MRRAYEKGTDVTRSRKTKYRNIIFRSELEARWAYCFDLLHLPWKYEPEGFEFDNGVSYIPDFWLPSIRAYYETKPESFSAVDERKAWYLAVENSVNVFIAVGIPAWPYDRPSGQIYRFSPNGRILSGYRWSNCERSGYLGLTWGGALSEAYCAKEHNHTENDTGDSTGRIISAIVLSRLAVFRRAK